MEDNIVDNADNTNQTPAETIKEANDKRSITSKANLAKARATRLQKLADQQKKAKEDAEKKAMKDAEKELAKESKKKPKAPPTKYVEEDSGSDYSDYSSEDEPLIEIRKSTRKAPKKSTKQISSDNRLQPQQNIDYDILSENIVSKLQEARSKKKLNKKPAIQQPVSPPIPIPIVIPKIDPTEDAMVSRWLKKINSRG